MSNELISIIIPCKNEENYIANTLDSIIEGDFPFENLEVFVVDGMSDDNTQEILQKYMQKYSQIHIINNPQQTVPYAMNYGIEAAKGNTIVRLDAHSIYPKNYIAELVKYLNKLDADNVGGVWDTMPANSSLEAQAIAYASSHPFGIGNAQYRISNKVEPYEVDTVPFGCYKKEVFEKIGLYDTDLTRNQDDELNARLLQNNGKIFLIPSLKIKYFARDKFSKMFKMFYQYGYFKPLVNMKLLKPATLRQFVPVVFVLFLLLGALLSLFVSGASYIFGAGLVFYFIVNMIVSFLIAKNQKNLMLIPYLMYTFFLIHLSYGLGYLMGIVDFMILKKHMKKNSNKIKISR